MFHGPDFATGGLVVDSAEAISHAYRHRARQVPGARAVSSRRRQITRRIASAGIERQKGGGYQLVISEIPYQVPKGKLIEQIAQAIGDKKLPILEDVRDESDEQIRIVLVPAQPQCRSRTAQGIGLQADRSGKPFQPQSQRARSHPHADGDGAEGTADPLGGEPDRHPAAPHPTHRLDKIADRLELLEGYIIAFLNLDRVIEIIRTEDEPKP